MKILDARITKMPLKFLDPMPEVYVTYENGIEEFLFKYYPDEISFHPKEFIGLTKAEALHLKYLKDKDYLKLWKDYIIYYYG